MNAKRGFRAAFFRSVTVFSLAASASVTGGALPRAAGAEPAPASAQPLDEAAAAAEARASGRRVEVTAKRTETDTFYANPNGTMTYETSAAPVRVRRDGGWVAVDPTLVRQADGSVAPVATVLDMRLSGGGSAPLARVTKDGKSVALSWPAPLPAPTLSGAKATYAEVLPGVDLVVTAMPESVSEVLVVKTREAGLNPALRRLVFPTTTSGLTLEAAPGGGLVAVDAAGEAVLGSPEPTMWDSRGSSAGSRTTKAAEGDVLRRMRVEAHPGHVAVVPDATLLADPATRYPVYLDPTIATMGHNNWGMVDEYYPANEYYKFASDEGVGYQNFDGVSRKRQFHTMATTAVAGNYIVSATFSAWETHASSCTATEVELWLTGAYYSTTNWSNMGSWTRELDNAVISRGRAGCTNPEGWVDFDAKSAVAEAASKSWVATTFGLKAASETNNLYWKRFRYDAKLVVDYSRQPNTPTSMKLQNPFRACVVGTDRPVINDANPEVSAYISDPDTGTNLRAEFEWGLVGGTRYTWLAPETKASGSMFNKQIPNTGSFSSGGVYSFRMRGWDGYEYGAYASKCEFQMDLNPPDPITVASTDFPQDQRSLKTVGQSGTFTFTANAADADVVSYKYSVNSDSYGSSIAAPTLSAPATITYPVDKTGRNWLVVRGVDRAGNLGTPVTYEFGIAGASRNAEWKLNDDPARVAVDTVGAREAALATSVTWGDGDDTFNPDPPNPQPDRAPVFDGTGSAEVAMTPVASGSPFTVAFRAYLDKPAGELASYYAVGQRGVNNSAFRVGYRSVTVNSVTSYNWFFDMASADVASPTWTRVELPATTRQWTHLTALYTGESIQLHMSVQDPLTGAITRTSARAAFKSTWTAGGSLHIGGGHLGSTFVGWAGRIDDVVTYDRPIDNTEIVTLASEVG